MSGSCAQPLSGRASFCFFFGGGIGMPFPHPFCGSSRHFWALVDYGKLAGWRGDLDCSEIGEEPGPALDWASFGVRSLSMSCFSLASPQQGDAGCPGALGKAHVTSPLADVGVAGWAQD